MSVSGRLADGPFQSETSEIAPSEIPSRYECSLEVGAGGMGIVYQARDRETGEVVALKVLRAEVAADPAMQENLRNEVRIARKVTHKNVCRIHEFNRSGEQTYISMEFVEGKSLFGLLQQNGRMPWNEAVKIGKQICAGLAEAHAQGIVHRDLKPANIMIDAVGVAKIMDFGIARVAQNAVQMTSTMIGTPAYMAPEQVAGRGVDARTDIYGVGLLLYTMVTSSEAFAGSAPLAVALKQLREFPTPVREVVPGLPAHAEAIIVKCIQKDPAKRFQSMDELSAALTDEPQVMANAPVRDVAEPSQPAGYGASRSAQLIVNHATKFLQRFDSNFLRSRQTQKALVAELAGLCLLGGLIFSLPKSTKTTSSPGAASLAQAASAPPPETKPSVLFLVDAKIPHVRESAKISRINTISAKHTASRNSKASTLRSPKNQPPASAPPVPLIAGNVAPTSVVTPINSIDASITTSAATNAGNHESAANHESNKRKIEKTLSGLGTVVRSIVPRGGPAESGFQSKPTEESAALSETYIEVGVFKDSKPADKMVDELSKLGFHATCVRRSVLWKQSYQVRVGPFTNAEELSAAQHEIDSDGFNVRVVK